MKKKKIKKKSFFFEDYNESEISFNKKNINFIKISNNRVVFLFSIFLSLILIFSIKIVYISLYPDRNFSSKDNNSSITKERRDIVYRK